MGLDIFLFRANRRGLAKKQARMEEINKEESALYHLEKEEFVKPENQAKLDALKQEWEEIYPYVEVAYFRKVNLLVRYFNYKDNCSNQELSKEKIESLVKDCQKVLDLHQKYQDEDITDKLEELLATTSGPFFGGTDYDDWYFKDVEDVLTQFKKILATTKWKSEKIYLHCWW